MPPGPGFPSSTSPTVAAPAPARTASRPVQSSLSKSKINLDFYLYLSHLHQHLINITPGRASEREHPWPALFPNLSSSSQDQVHLLKAIISLARQVFFSLRSARLTSLSGPRRPLVLRLFSFSLSSIPRPTHSPIRFPVDGICLKD